MDEFRELGGGAIWIPMMRKVFYMRDVEETIREVNGTMAIEGLPLTEEDENRLRDLLHGRVSIDGIIKQLTEKYSKAVAPVSNQA